MSQCTWLADYVKEHLSKFITQKPEIIEGPIKAHDWARGPSHQSRLPLGLRISSWFGGANNLDCWRASRRRKAFHCACGWKADCVCRAWIGDLGSRRIDL